MTWHRRRGISRLGLALGVGVCGRVPDFPSAKRDADVEAACTLERTIVGAPGIDVTSPAEGGMTRQPRIVARVSCGAQVLTSSVAYTKLASGSARIHLSAAHHRNAPTGPCS
eukprot:scaffold347_cov380-Prasinococcus_capsulatus_cf.AAC.37